MKNNYQGKPLDPVEDFEKLKDETSGSNGITPSHENISTYKNPINMNSKSTGKSKLQKEGLSKGNPQELGDVDVMDDESRQNETLDEEFSPSVIGEQSVSGDMTDPSSDDDTLSNAHTMGIALDENSEHPQELDIAADVDEAEEYIRTH